MKGPLSFFLFGFAFSTLAGRWTSALAGRSKTGGGGEQSSAMPIESNTESSDSTSLSGTLDKLDELAFEVFRFFIGPADSLKRVKSKPSSRYRSTFKSGVGSRGLVGISATTEFCDRKIDSSLSGESTFLKKLRMLALGFPTALPAGVFFTVGRLLDGALIFELGRGVRGLVGPRDAIVDVGCRDVRPFGGVGGLPVDGLRGVSAVGDEFPRGFRNIIVLSLSP